MTTNATPATTLIRWTEDPGTADAMDYTRPFTDTDRAAVFADRQRGKGWEVQTITACTEHGAPGSVAIELMGTHYLHCNACHEGFERHMVAARAKASRARSESAARAYAGAAHYNATR